MIIGLHPGVVVEAALVFHRHDDILARALQGGRRVDLQRHLLAGPAGQRLADVGQLGGGPSVNRHDEVAFLDVDADVGQGRPERGIPVLALQDLRDLEELRGGVALEPRAEQAHRDARHLRQVAAADVGVAGVQLADHLADDVGQVGAVVDVVHQRRVLGAYGRPVHAVHVGREEEVAHLPPRLVEHLVPLGVPIDGDPHGRQIQVLTQFGPGHRRVDDGVAARRGDDHLRAIGGSRARRSSPFARSSVL
jgi:hypothetical protein